MGASLFELLEQDHQKVKLIVEKLLGTTSNAKHKRQMLLLELKNELQQHEQIEEGVVYPILKDKNLTHDLTLEAYQEHHVVDTLLAELESLEFKDENWKAKLTVLQENLLHHIQEEEGDLFMKAKKALTDEELATMETSIAEAKNYLAHA